MRSRPKLRTDFHTKPARAAHMAGGLSAYTTAPNYVGSLHLMKTCNAQAALLAAALLASGCPYLPGKGRWMIVGPRKLASFDRAQLAVRDESALASEISKKWFPMLLPMSVQLAQEYHPGDTIILQTPPGK